MNLIMNTFQARKSSEIVISKQLFIQIRKVNKRESAYVSTNKDVTGFQDWNF